MPLILLWGLSIPLGGTELRGKALSQIGGWAALGAMSMDKSRECGVHESVLDRLH